MQGLDFLLYTVVLLAGLTLGTHSLYTWVLDRETSMRVGWEEFASRVVLASLLAGWAYAQLTGIL